MCRLLRLAKKQSNVTVQVIQTISRNLPSALRLRQNEGPLEDGLNVFGEAVSTPQSVAWVFAQCRGDILLQHGRVLAEALLAGLQDRRVRLVRLLHQAAEQAGEFRQFPPQERLAKLHISQQALDGIDQLPIGNGTEQSFRQRRKMSGRRDRQRFLAGKVVEEGALGHTCRLTQVIDRRRGITLGANDIHGRIQQLGFRALSGPHRHSIPTGWYGRKTSCLPSTLRAMEHAATRGHHADAKGPAHADSPAPESVCPAALCL